MCFNVVLFVFIVFVLVFFILVFVIDVDYIVGFLIFMYKVYYLKKGFYYVFVIKIVMDDING